MDPVRGSLQVRPGGAVAAIWAAAAAAGLDASSLFLCVAWDAKTLSYTGAECLVWDVGLVRAPTPGSAAGWVTCSCTSLGLFSVALNASSPLLTLNWTTSTAASQTANPGRPAARVVRASLTLSGYFGASPFPPHVLLHVLLRHRFPCMCFASMCETYLMRIVMSILDAYCHVDT